MLSSSWSCHVQAARSLSACLPYPAIHLIIPKCTVFVRGPGTSPLLLRTTKLQTRRTALNLAVMITAQLCVIDGLLPEMTADTSLPGQKQFPKVWQPMYRLLRSQC